MANMVNSCILEGNLVRDGVLSYTSTGSAILKASVASNRSYRKGEETVQEVSFFDIELWGNQAERFQQYAKKGACIRVVGRLKQDRWQDKEGKTRTAVKIVAEHLELKKFEKKQEQAPKTVEPQEVQLDNNELDYIPF